MHVGNSLDPSSVSQKKCWNQTLIIIIFITTTTIIITIHICSLEFTSTCSPLTLVCGRSRCRRRSRKTDWRNTRCTCCPEILRCARCAALRSPPWRSLLPALIASEEEDELVLFPTALPTLSSAFHLNRCIMSECGRLGEFRRVRVKCQEKTSVCKTLLEVSLQDRGLQSWGDDSFLCKMLAVHRLHTSEHNCVNCHQLHLMTEEGRLAPSVGGFKSCFWK